MEVINAELQKADVLAKMARFTSPKTSYFKLYHLSDGVFAAEGKLKDVQLAWRINKTATSLDLEWELWVQNPCVYLYCLSDVYVLSICAFWCHFLYPPLVCRSQPHR